jgi:predicted metal-binding membrane protein
VPSHAPRAGRATGASRPSVDRAALLVGAALLVVAVLAWVVLLCQARAPGDSVSGTMAMDGPIAGWSTLGEGVAFIGAWAVMMAAMMLPSAAPMIALYSAVHRNIGATGQRGVPTALFAVAYGLVWAAVGVPVYFATLGVSALASSEEMVGMALPYGVALVLVAAAVYQLTPLKSVCLRACRSPLGFLIGNWRAGLDGTLRLGLNHAAYCVGCCWALMAVLVAAGAMGLAWVVLVTLAVFAEKVLPRGEWTARAIGLALLALGVVVAAQPGMVPRLRGGM